MARVKPRIKIPYKRYEKSFDRSQETGGEEEDGFIILKDITANPSVVTTNLKHERPEQLAASDAIAHEEPQSNTEPDKAPGEVTLNKRIKIRRKLR